MKTAQMKVDYVDRCVMRVLERRKMKAIWQHEETGRIVFHEAPGKRWVKCPQVLSDSIADILEDIANSEPVNGNTLAQMRVLLAAEQVRRETQK